MRVFGIRFDRNRILRFCRLLFYLKSKKDGETDNNIAFVVFGRNYNRLPAVQGYVV